MRKTVLFLFIVSYLAIPSEAQKKKIVPPPDPFQKLDSFVIQKMAEWKVPGCALSIVKDGKLLFAKGYGIKDIKTNAPVSANTLFPIASCSKSFTSACLAILADEGKLDWDKPVWEYMPDFELYDAYATRHVTARELVSHRTGLPRHDWVWVSSGLNRKEMFGRLKYLPPTKPIYAQYQYNNLMYMAAGVLIERLSGKTWETFMREKILSPLSMNRTVLTYPELFKSDDYSQSYRDEEGKAIEDDFKSNVDAIGPAGAVKSSVTEMSNWLLMQLGNGKLGEKVIVSEKNLKENHTPQTVIAPAEAKYAELGFGSYGMGWIMNSYRGHQRRQHNGSIEGFRSQMTVFPNDNLGVFITTNTGAADYYFVNTITNFVADKWLNMSLVDWSSRYQQERTEAKANAEKAKQENAARRQTTTKPSHTLESYAGVYEHPAYGKLELSVKDGKLTGFFHENTFNLTHYHYDIFEGDTIFDMLKFSFDINNKGQISQVLIGIPNAGDTVFVKK